MQGGNADKRKGNKALPEQEGIMMNYNEQEEMVERVEQNIQECQSDDGFDWEEYQYLCDIAEYWNCEE